MTDPSEQDRPLEPSALGEPRASDPPVAPPPAADPTASARPRVEAPGDEPEDDIDRRTLVVFLVGILLTGLSLVAYEWSDNGVLLGLTVIGVGVLGASLGMALSGRRAARRGR